MWDLLHEHLPRSSLIDECWLAYKPWLRDKTHHYKAYVRWYTGPKVRGWRPWTWAEAFGSTPDEALHNLAEKMIERGF